MPSSQLSSTLEDLQLQLRICDCMHKRASIRLAIQQLRQKQDPLLRGTSIRRSRRRFNQRHIELSKPDSSNPVLNQSSAVEKDASLIKKSLINDGTTCTDCQAIGTDSTSANQFQPVSPAVSEEGNSPSAPARDEGLDDISSELMYGHPHRRSRRKLARSPIASVASSVDDPRETSLRRSIRRETRKLQYNEEPGNAKSTPQGSTGTSPIPGPQLADMTRSFPEIEQINSMTGESFHSESIQQENCSSTRNNCISQPLYELTAQSLPAPGCDSLSAIAKNCDADVIKGSGRPEAGETADNAPVRALSDCCIPREVSAEVKSDSNRTFKELTDDNKEQYNEINSVLSPPSQRSNSESSGKRLRSRSPFSRLLKIKSSNSHAVKEQPTSPLPTEDKDLGFGKRRFSKRFRKKTSKANSFAETSEVVKGVAGESDSFKKLPSELPTSHVACVDVDSATLHVLDISQDRPSTPQQISPKAPPSDSDYSRKHSARVVLRTIGKKLFTSKQKSSSDLEPRNKKTNYPSPVPSLINPTSTQEENETKIDSSTNSISIASPVSFSSSKYPSTSEEVNFPISKKLRPSVENMEVLSRPREGARTPNHKSSYSQEERHEATLSPSVDYEDMSVSELKFLLNTSSDLQEREKIRSVIRSLLEESEDASPVSSVNFQPKPVGAALRRSSPVLQKGSPLLTRSQPTFNVTFNNNTVAQKADRPWDPKPSKKSSFRSVSTPTSRAESKESHSTSTRNPESQEDSEPRVGSNPNTRFGKREFSASVRAFRPSYKPEQNSINRSESLKLQRPKDFLKTSSAISPVPVESSSPSTFAHRSVSRPTAITPSSVVRSPSPQASGINVSGKLEERLESSTDNQTATADQNLPFVPIVRGNKRRSRVILGKILGFKIDSEKHHPQETPSPKSSLTTGKPASPITSPNKSLSSVTEEAAILSPTEHSSSSSLTHNDHSLKTTTPPSLSAEACVVDKADKKQPTEVSIDVSTASSKKEEPKEDSEQTPVLSSEDRETLSAEDPLTSEVSDLIEYLINNIVSSSDTTSFIKETLLNLEYSEEPEKSPLPSLDQVDSHSSKNVEEFIENKAESVILLDKTDSVEIPYPKESIDSNHSSTVQGNPSTFLIKDQPNSFPDDLGANAVESSESKSSDTESEDQDTSSISSGLRSDSSGNEVDFEDEMEGRYSIKNRYGGNGGSVKSRIMATEDTCKNTAVDVANVKKTRQTADLRAFRNAEGVKSRMNKFSSAVNTSPSSDSSPRKKVDLKNRKTEINGDAKQSNRPSSTRKERTKRYEKSIDDVNNNNVSKSPLISRSKYSSDIRSKKTVSNGDVTERMDKKTVQKISKENGRHAAVTKTTVETTVRESKASAKEEFVQSNIALESKPGAPLAEEKTDEKLAANGDKEMDLPQADDASLLASEGHMNENIAPSEETLSTSEEKETQQGAPIEQNGTASETPIVQVNGSVSKSHEDERIDRASTCSDSRPAQSSQEEDDSQKHQTTTDVVEEKFVPPAPAKRVRTRRRDRSEKTSPNATESEATDSAKDVSEEKQSQDKLRLTKLEISENTEKDDMPVAARRRRRVRNSPDPSKSSTSSSVASTPEQDIKTTIIESPKTETASNLSSSDAGHGLTTIPSSELPVTEPEEEASVNAVNENIEVPSKPEEASDVAVEETIEQIEAKKEDIVDESDAVNKEAQTHDSPSIKLKRVWSAPDNNLALAAAGEEIQLSDATSNSEPLVIEEEKSTESADDVAFTKERVTVAKHEKTEEVEDDISTTPESPAEIQYTLDNLEECPDETILQKLLENADSYDDRKRIRSALRALKKAKAGGSVNTPKQNSTGKWQSHTTTRTTTTVKTGRNTTTKTTVTTKTESKESKSRTPTGRLQSLNTSSPASEKASTDPKSLAEKYGLTSPVKKDMTSGTKKIGSIFDREEEAPKKTSNRLDVERRQADRRKEVTRNRSMPASSAKDARKMFVAKLEGDGGAGKGKKVGRSPTFVVPNANNVKQMLLKWCQAKTRGYDHVDINNYSSSWNNGMAFCALVHNFFPDAFDYSELDPKNRAHNFDLAFKTAEKHANADPLLDVEDMIIMGNRPDSKCVFTYVQSLYNKLRKFEKPLVPLTPEKKSEANDEKTPGSTEK